jgi:hypothetical protein
MKNMRKNIEKKDRKAGKLLGVGIISAVITGFIVSMFILFTVNDAIVTPVVTEETRTWVRKTLRPVGDADPGAGISGWLNMTVYQNDSDPSNYYARNLTNNDSSYAWTNTNNSHAGSDVPHSTEFALVYKIRVNVSDGYSSGNATWMPTWIRCNVTSAGLSLSDVGMDRYVIGDNATYMWLNFVYNDGIEITPGQNVTVCQFYVDMYQ